MKKVFATFAFLLAFGLSFAADNNKTTQQDWEALQEAKEFLLQFHERAEARAVIKQRLSPKAIVAFESAIEADNTEKSSRHEDAREILAACGACEARELRLIKNYLALGEYPLMKDEVMIAPAKVGNPVKAVAIESTAEPAMGWWSKFGDLFSDRSVWTPILGIVIFFGLLVIGCIPFIIVSTSKGKTVKVKFQETDLVLNGTAKKKDLNGATDFLVIQFGTNVSLKPLGYKVNEKSGEEIVGKGTLVPEPPKAPKPKKVSWWKHHFGGRPLLEVSAQAEPKVEVVATEVVAPEAQAAN